MMKPTWKLYTTVILFALVAGVWVGIFRDGHEGDKQQQSLAHLQATVLEKPRELNAFSLIDSHNNPFTNDNLKNKWSFLFFGFTTCPSICPTTMAEMKSVFSQLPKGKYDTEMVLVTVDPETDTPEQLKNYLEKFNPAFIGVTGDDAELTKLRQQLGILALRNEHHQEHDHTTAQDAFDHSGTIVLIDPKGNFYALFSMPHSAENIVSDFTKIQQYYQGEK